MENNGLQTLKKDVVLYYRHINIPCCDKRFESLSGELQKYVLIIKAFDRYHRLY